VGEIIRWLRKKISPKKEACAATGSKIPSAAKNSLLGGKKKQLFQAKRGKGGGPELPGGGVLPQREGGWRQLLKYGEERITSKIKTTEKKRFCSCRKKPLCREKKKKLKALKGGNDLLR